MAIFVDSLTSRLQLQQTFPRNGVCSPILRPAVLYYLETSTFLAHTATTIRKTLQLYGTGTIFEGSFEDVATILRHEQIMLPV